MTNTNFNKEVARILVFRIGELGDTLIALPALRAIRNRFPAAHLALLSNTDNRARHVSPQQILPPGLVDEWMFYPTDEGAGLSARFQLFKRLRQGRFDLLAYLVPRIRRAGDIRRDLAFFRLAGIRQVIGQNGCVPLPRQPGGALARVEHEADHLLQRLSLSGILVPAPGSAKFELELRDDEQRTTELWWQAHVPVTGAASVIGFGPGSKWPSKIWPEERFADVGRRLIEACNVFPIVFGGPEDRELGERLLRVWGRGANAAGELSVRQAAAALARCAVYVGNDTGTMHLAAAVATPCIAIMSALDWPGHWNPYGAGHIVLRRSVPCEGCLLRVCDREGMRCLKEIAVDEVVDACVATLSRKENCTGEIVTETQREEPFGRNDRSTIGATR